MPSEIAYVKQPSNTLTSNEIDNPNYPDRPTLDTSIIQVPGYAVRLNKDSLFSIYVKIGSFSPKERALAISQRVQRLYELATFNPDLLESYSSENSVDIIYNNEEVIISINPEDAFYYETTPEELANAIILTIKDRIQIEREAHSWENISKRLGLTSLIVLGTAAFIYGSHRLFLFIAKKISQSKNKLHSSTLLSKAKIIKPEHIEKLLLQLNNLAELLVVLLSIYLTLPLIFSLFPETAAWGSTLLDWIIAPLKSMFSAAVAYLPDVIQILLIFALFKYSIRLIRYVFMEIQRGHITFKGFHADWALPTFNILRFMLYAFMLVLIFPLLPGSNSPAFQGVSVFLGILISLGSSSAIANIVAGLVITYMRPFRIGDRVKIGDSIGDVMEKSMLVTRIKTVKNEDITVPNSMILSSTTTNFSNHTKNESNGLIVHYTVTVGYDLSWERVYSLLIEAASQTQHILKDPKPFVLQTQLNDFNISYQINAYTKEANLQSLIYSKLLENIQNVFHREGIELCSPSIHVIQKKTELQIKRLK